MNKTELAVLAEGNVVLVARQGHDGGYQSYGAFEVVDPEVQDYAERESWRHGTRRHKVILATPVYEGRRGYPIDPAIGFNHRQDENLCWVKTRNIKGGDPELVFDTVADYEAWRAALVAQQEARRAERQVRQDEIVAGKTEAKTYGDSTFRPDGHCVEFRLDDLVKFIEDYGPELAENLHVILTLDQLQAIGKAVRS